MKPRKLRDRTIKLEPDAKDGGSVQFTSPRWDWESWDDRVLVTFTPNYHGIGGAALLTVAECKALANELHRRANNLGNNARYRATLTRSETR